MIILQNKDTGLTKECSTGFSWTTFFFGVFVPLVRGDLKWAFILFLLTALVGIFTFGIGSFFVGPIFAVFYNKIYIRGLMANGFIPADDSSYNWCVVNGLVHGNLRGSGMGAQKEPVEKEQPQEVPLLAENKEVKMPLLEKKKEEQFK